MELLGFCAVTLTTAQSELWVKLPGIHSWEDCSIVLKHTRTLQAKLAQTSLFTEMLTSVHQLSKCTG